MKIVTMMILSLLIFSGCVTKKEVVFEPIYICNELVKINRPTAKIRVLKKDIEIAKNYKNAINDSFNFYETQVDENNKLCKELRNENK